MNIIRIKCQSLTGLGGKTNNKEVFYVSPHQGQVEEDRHKSPAAPAGCMHNKRGGPRVSPFSHESVPE